MRFVSLAKEDIMNTKKLLLIAVTLLLAQACNETQDPDTGEHSTPLSCISFTDTAFGIYAMSNWDTDHNGCLTVAESQSVQSLPDSAFAGNTALQSLNDLNSFPNLTVIGNNAFAGCTSLVSANLPNIKTVGNNAFAGCTNLVSVQLPNASNISDNAFEGCTALNGITIPKWVKNIRKRAFAGCSGLTSVSIPQKVTSIADGLFEACGNLSSVELPGKLTHIGDKAFAGCGQLSEMTLPKIVRNIGDHAFRGCGKLSGIRIPDRTVSIGKQAFGYDDSGAPLPGFSLSGRAGSEADHYAQANGIRFISD